MAGRESPWGREGEQVSGILEQKCRDYIWVSKLKQGKERPNITKPHRFDHTESYPTSSS